MVWQPTVYAAPTLFATAIALCFGGYALQLRRTRGGGPTLHLFLLITVGIAVWTGFSALKLLHTDPATKLLFYRLLHVGAAVLPPLFLLFALAYTDRDRWLRPGVIAAVFAFPAVFVALLLVNPGELVIDGVTVSGTSLVVLRVDDGPAFLLFIAYSTVLTLCALGIIGYETARVGRAYYPQAAWLALGAGVPMLFGVCNTVGVPPFDAGFNLVPTSGAISALSFGFVVARYRLFDLPPLAYTTAMRYSPDGLFVLDPTGRIVQSNPSGRAMLDELAVDDDTPMSALLGPPEAATAAPDVVEATTDGGVTTYFQPLVVPLSRGGHQVGWVVVLRDVTDQQHREQQLHRQASQLEAFTSTVSHDLRNPLAVASGFLELAREDPSPATLDRIETAHERMAAIIEDLLVLAKQGDRIEAPLPVSLGTLAADTWRNVETASATLTVDGDLTVLGDESTLRHVFENVFRNAIEHGGPTVEVTVGWLDDGFYVEDTGPGIPAADRETVLEPGFTTTREGTGFGLGIVQSVVNAHGWTLTVTEGSAGGARFEFGGVELVE